MSIGPTTGGGVEPELRVEQSIKIPPRPGMAKTIYYFSYSGGMVLEGPLPTLGCDLGTVPIDISVARLGHPSFRATPQFTNRSFETHFGGPPQFPVQTASFVAPATEEGASINYWEGPTEHPIPGAPALPADTLIVTAHGPNSGDVGELLESRILRPLLEWVRALTDQWWVGRSYERISGPLHFIAPVDANNRVLGRPIAFSSMTTGGPKMVPLTANIWAEAGRRAVAGVPPAERGLATDAKYMFVSKEYRSGAILACCAFEAARDALLEAAGLRLRALGGYDLRKHLASGFEKAFGRNIATERPDLASLLSAFWLARHNAAHGKDIVWRHCEGDLPIETVSIAAFTDGIDDILAWISSVASSAM